MASLPKKAERPPEVSMEEGDIDESIKALTNMIEESYPGQQMLPSEFFIRSEDKLRTIVNNYGNVVIGSSSSSSSATN